MIILTVLENVSKKHYSENYEAFASELTENLEINLQIK